MFATGVTSSLVFSTIIPYTTAINTRLELTVLFTYSKDLKILDLKRKSSKITTYKIKS